MPRCAHLAKMVATGFYTLKEDAEGPVLRRICKGLLASDETKPSILEYVKRQWTSMKAR
jgi:hypothetical protein